MVLTTIEINRQDSFGDILSTRDDNGDLIDASGWTIYFTVRREVVDTSIYTDSDAVISVEIAGQSSGLHTLSLTPTQTNIEPGNYFYDVQVKKSDTDIESSGKKLFIVNGDITRTI